ncbi:MAG: helicase C-terminal domain-containing protein, partial [Myxococcota bacterium]
SAAEYRQVVAGAQDSTDTHFLAIVDLETTGLSVDEGAELLEFGAVLVDPGRDEVVTLATLLRPAGKLPRAVARLTGLADADLVDAPVLADVKPALAEALAGRVVIAHNADFERTFLSRYVDPGLANATFLDTLDLLALTHPDAPDLRLESFTRMLLGTEERHRALDDALDTARVMALAGQGASEGEARFVAARRACEAFAPDSPWLGLLEKPSEIVDVPAEPPFVVIGETRELPVPFDEDAIAAVLADEPRGRRHFPGYRVRKEQIELARAFVRTLAQGEVLLAEGGTGVGKSLAYLAAAIPFAMEQEAAGEGGPKDRASGPPPVLISTRTKLLQDQLVGRDVAAAARLLGYPELRALAIKGRANYACARRLDGVLAEGRQSNLFPEDRIAYAVLEACARTRSHGEIGTVPAALLRRYRPLRDLLRRSVAARSEQCTRDQCAKERDCPLGRRRAALHEAHLVVANHDLLLRWPPDYPAFEHAIVDEVHELPDVADEVYALSLRPDDVLERVDELFGRPSAPGKTRGEALLGAGARKKLEKDARAWRRDLRSDLTAIGRALEPLAGEFGDVQVRDGSDRVFAAAAKSAGVAVERIDGIAEAAQNAARSETKTSEAITRSIADLRAASQSLALAFDGAGPDAVVSFEDVQPPHDRWRLVVRPVAPGADFDRELLSRLRSFAGVSASLFVGGDALAALGDLELEQRSHDRLARLSVPSPFNYRDHMRVVALRGGADLVRETADVLETLARRLGGRTLGLFTSLRRMDDVANELAHRLRGEGIDVITPRRAADDPSALVARFVNGAAVLLGARRFWQGIDIPGDALQAVVIEKLPFEVPTELRKRREARLAEHGISAFERMSLGRMLLNLKQMVGRLIRSEEDRGLVVIVESRADKRYFRRLVQALPKGSEVVLAEPSDLDRLLAEVGIAGES